MITSVLKWIVVKCELGKELGVTWNPGGAVISPSEKFHAELFSSRKSNLHLG